MNPPPPADPNPGLRSVWSRWRQRFSRRDPSASGNGRPGQRADDPLIAAGQKLLMARQSRGLGLRQLADETRISTPVLEALERGWRDRLPEAAYLRMMLPLLEHHLDLEAGSLQAALPEPSASQRPGRRGAASGLARFTPGSIDVFTSWEGTLIYGLLTVALVLGLNRQQQVLVRQGIPGVEPQPIEPLTGRGAGSSPQTTRAASAGAAPLDDLLQAFPELRPLQRAAAGQALPRWRQDHPSLDLGLGQLRLNLVEPTRLSLSSRSGTSRLERLQGELVLPVMPPFQLQLEPQPGAQDAVAWNGKPLAGDRQGRYRFPAAARP